MSIKVSVFCLTYNQEKFIDECLNGLVNQKTDFDYEIIVNDDHSTDNTVNILEKYKSKYPEKFKLVLQKNNQFSKGLRNFIPRYLIPKAAGKYFAICEGDDYWTDENKLQKQVDFLEKNKDFALCFSPTKVIFENKEQDSSIWPASVTKESLTVPNLIKENFIPTVSVMYRRQNYDKLSLDVVPGDWYMHIYHAQFGRIGYIDDVMSVYRRHKGGLWWNNYSNPTKHLEENGIRMLGLLEEVTKLYIKDSAVLNQVNDTATNLLMDLANSAKGTKSSYIKNAIREHEEFTIGLIQQLSKKIQEQNNFLMRDKEKIDELTKEADGLRSLNRGLEEGVKYLQNEIEGLNNSPLVGKTIKAARLKARLVEDIRLNKGAAIRRKVYRKTLQKPVNKAMNSYVQKRLKYNVISNKRANNTKPLVSVIIPYYNRHETIMETLDSVHRQTFTDYEVIVVDDGSTEQLSISILGKIKRHPTNPLIIRQKNKGVAVARNNGIKQSSGRYIMCLDSDDILRPLYIEKCVTVLESDPDASLVTTGIEAFGVSSWAHIHQPYDPSQLFAVNLVGTASMCRKEAWKDAGGYKSNIGYEDWDLWLSMAEKGHWGRRIPELLFLYRTANESRFIEDRAAHDENVKKIQSHHPNYKKTIKQLMRERRFEKRVSEPKSAFVNLGNKNNFLHVSNKPHVLILMPWMTFGGAETLIINFSKELADDYRITYMTGLDSDHVWHGRFEEISNRIYHLSNMFDNRNLYLEFISNYIKTHSVNVIHMVHTNFAYEFVEELKKRHPNVKVVLTMFNSRVNHFPDIEKYIKFIDAFTSDNSPVVREYIKLGVNKSATKVIPNGIDSTTTFNPAKFDEEQLRKKYKLKSSDLSVFFIGRLSEEKNPDVFVKVAEYFAKDDKYKSLRFFIVGDGGMKNEIKSSIKNIHNIEYLGYRSDIPQVLSMSDVFVLPSSIEGFPLSILEAMAMENVSIASAVGAIPDIIEEGETGFIVSPGSINEIVDSLHYLSDNRDKIANIQEKSRIAVVKKYSSEMLGKNYKSLYKDVMK